MVKEIDLMDELYCDTYLSVKLTKRDGNPGFVHYIIKRERQDRSVRLYGHLFSYYTLEMEGFRFATGYVLKGHNDPEFWSSGDQYLYFDKKTLPQFNLRKSKRKLFLPKNRWQQTAE